MPVNPALGNSSLNRVRNTHRSAASDTVSSARDTDVEPDEPNDGTFTTYQSRNQKKSKKRRLANSPNSGTSVVEVSAISHDLNNVQPPPPSRAAKKILLIGSSNVSTLKASKTLQLKKSVYRLGNIDSKYTAVDVQKYVEGLGIRVISCFERVPPIGKKYDNKTFRLCIIDFDKYKLLSDNNWSTGVTIQKWVFKPKESDAVFNPSQDDTRAGLPREQSIMASVPATLVCNSTETGLATSSAGESIDPTILVYNGGL